MARRWVGLIVIVTGVGCFTNDPPPVTTDFDVYEALIREHASSWVVPSGKTGVLFVGYCKGIGRDGDTKDPPAEFLNRFRALPIKVKPISESTAFSDFDDSKLDMIFCAVRWVDESNCVVAVACCNKKAWCGTAWDTRLTRQDGKWTRVWK